VSDIHLIPGAVASEAEREAVDRAIGNGPAARHLLLPALHAAQGRAGWISEGALNHICDRLSVPPAEAYGVASFYAMFALKPRPGRVVHVCDDIACKTRGADAICETLTVRFGKPGEPANGDTATWLRSPCLGLCEQAPAALVQAAGEKPVDLALPATSIDEISAVIGDSLKVRSSKFEVRGSGVPHVPQTLALRDSGLRLLRRVGIANPRVSTSTAPTAAIRPCAGPSKSAPSGLFAKSWTRSSSAAVARRFRRDASGRPWRVHPSDRTT
jgi:NADH-quinone oxidoreductase subunit F